MQRHMSFSICSISFFSCLRTHTLKRCSWTPPITTNHTHTDLLFRYHAYIIKQLEKKLSQFEIRRRSAESSTHFLLILILSLSLPAPPLILLIRHTTSFHSFSFSSLFFVISQQSFNTNTIKNVSTSISISILHSGRLFY